MRAISERECSISVFWVNKHYIGPGQGPTFKDRALWHSMFICLAQS